MNHLLRGHAPISDEGWKLIDTEARERLVPGLAARRLIDFAGPLGWEYSATNLGRVEDLDGRERPARGPAPPCAAARGAAGAVLGLARGAARRRPRAPRTSTSTTSTSPPASSRAPRTRPCSAAGARPGSTASAAPVPHPPIARGDDFDRYPSRVAAAVELLLRNGVGGPYGLALSGDDYTHVVETAEHGGYPLFAHLRQILEGPLVWTPGIEGAIVVSLRGGDFLFESGQDVSVGYESHDAERVGLYLEESFSFRVASPEAAVVIR